MAPHTLLACATAAAAWLLPCVDAQLLSSLLPTYFDSRPEGCTGPDDCSNYELMRLTFHIEFEHFWWGGFLEVTPDTDDKYFACLDSTDSMCLVWQANEFQRESSWRSSEYEVGTCQCEMPGSQCSLHRDAAKNLAPGNLSKYNDHTCDEVNYNADCGWDGGDCEGVPMFNGTVVGLEDGLLDYTVPTLGSDNYCAVWSCDQTEYGASTDCSSYSYYWRDRRALGEDGEAEGGSEQGDDNGGGGGRERRGLRCRSQSNVHVETKECACTTPADNGNYCWEWYCEELPGPGFEAEGSSDWYYSWYYDNNFNPTVSEWYECDQESSNGLYCAQWHAVMQTDPGAPTHTNGEIELASCTCDSTSVDDAGAGGGNNADDSDPLIVSDSNYELRAGFEGHCTRWTCEDRGWAYWTPSWASFGTCLFFILVFGCSFGMVFHMKRSSRLPKPRGIALFALVVVLLAVLGVYLVGWWSAGIVGGIVFSVAYLFVGLGLMGAFRKGGCQDLCERCKSKCEPSDTDTDGGGGGGGSSAGDDVVTLDGVELQNFPGEGGGEAPAHPVYPVARLAEPAYEDGKPPAEPTVMAAAPVAD